MTKTAIRRELHNIRYELDWLSYHEQAHNPEWRFRSAPFSKRHVRLMKTYWVLKALQANS